MTILQAESETAIIQRAYGWAEHDRNFDSLEDGSDEAREGKLRYDIRRRLVLEAIDWNFARRRVLPTVLPNAVTPTSQPYAFQKEANSLRVRSVQTGGRVHSWSVEEHVFSDNYTQGETQLIHTTDVQSPVQFPPSFTMALEFLIAAEFAMIFARSVNRSNVMLDRYRRAMIEADQVEGMERSDDEVYGETDIELAIERSHFGRAF